MLSLFVFFLPAPATTEIYTLSLHDALPIFNQAKYNALRRLYRGLQIMILMATTLLTVGAIAYWKGGGAEAGFGKRSEEHTSELQSRGHLVCRLLLEKKNKHSRSR